MDKQITSDEFRFMPHKELGKLTKKGKSSCHSLVRMLQKRAKIEEQYSSDLQQLYRQWIQPAARGKFDEHKELNKVISSVIEEIQEMSRVHQSIAHSIKDEHGPMKSIEEFWTGAAKKRIKVSLKMGKWPVKHVLESYDKYQKSLEEVTQPISVLLDRIQQTKQEYLQRCEAVEKLKKKICSLEGLPSRWSFVQIQRKVADVKKQLKTAEAAVVKARAGYKMLLEEEECNRYGYRMKLKDIQEKVISGEKMRINLVLAELTNHMTHLSQAAQCVVSSLSSIQHVQQQIQDVDVDAILDQHIASKEMSISHPVFQEYESSSEGLDNKERAGQDVYEMFDIVPGGCSSDHSNSTASSPSQQSANDSQESNSNNQSPPSVSDKTALLVAPRTILVSPAKGEGECAKGIPSCRDKKQENTHPHVRLNVQTLTFGGNGDSSGDESDLSIIEIIDENSKSGSLSSLRVNLDPAELQLGASGPKACASLKLPVKPTDNSWCVEDYTNKYVIATRFYLGQTKREFTLKKGDICKQKMPPNKNGMAYGWKRSLRGKSYGFFPVSHVQIFHGDKPSILRSLSLDH